MNVAPDSMSYWRIRVKSSVFPGKRRVKNGLACDSMDGFFQDCWRIELVRSAPVDMRSWAEHVNENDFVAELVLGVPKKEKSEKNRKLGSGHRVQNGETGIVLR